MTTWPVFSTPHAMYLTRQTVKVSLQCSASVPPHPGVTFMVMICLLWEITKHLGM